MSLLVRKIKTINEIRVCVNLYSNSVDHSFSPICLKTLIDNLTYLYYSREFLRVVEKDGEIIGWIFCAEGKNLHSANKIFEQKYFWTNQVGFSAFRIVKLLHQAMEDEAARRGVIDLLSCGSPADENNVFAKSLEKLGWTRQGYIVSKKLQLQLPQAKGFGRLFNCPM